MMTVEHVKRRQRLLNKKRQGKFIQLVNDYLGLCPYCQCDIRESYTIDHLTPMTSDGLDDDDNLVPCCRSCNSSKNNKSLIVYLATRTVNNVERYYKKIGISY